MANFRFTFVASVNIEAENYDEACKKYNEMQLFNEEANVDFGDTTHVENTDNGTQHLC